MVFYGVQGIEHGADLREMTDLYQPDNLVFSGGGIKGLSLIGAIKALEDAGKMAAIKGYAGTSAGAITAALLAIGMNADELQRQMMSMDYNLLFKRSNINIQALAQNPRKLLDPLIGGLVAYDEVQHKGLCDGSFAAIWLNRLFQLKGFSKDTTYRELYKATGKCLKITLCNLNYGKTVIASYENTPELPVIHSIRGSMAIPFIYWPFEWKGDVYVDGGLMYNYPIEIFDDSCSWDKTLGFLLTAKEQVNNPARKEDRNLWEHIGRLYEALMRVDDEYCFRTDNQKRTVFIDTKEVDVLDFDLSKEGKEALYKEGYMVTRNYLGAVVKGT
ncbi:MAG: patatin-like phospholipase family protein [Vallitaleaceae bacterium]|nr:patatin-like phospholipase family protein [Vallitaleaceae bacterium]